jgi:patatin-like phospholipase/acyl hydrolase
MSPDNASPTDKFRILACDGGGIRGLISALVLGKLEYKIQELTNDEGARLSDYFHLFAGTSTGGLIALGLTAPEVDITAEELALLYTEDGPDIFHVSATSLLGTLGGLTGPKYSPDSLKAALERRLGTAQLASALRDLVVTSYDMTGREPYFFKRWRARESKSSARNAPLVDAALATAAAPTYFPSHPYDDRALVDGGVFAMNPVIAAITEALKRSGDEPVDLTTDDLLVVSVGTGAYETSYPQSEVEDWGKLGWIGSGRDEPPLLGAVFGGSAEAADHWAHMLLNYPHGGGLPDSGNVGRGPRFFRWQAKLPKPVEMDDVSEEALNALSGAASQLNILREAEVKEVAQRVTAAGPIPPT